MDRVHSLVAEIHGAAQELLASTTTAARSEDAQAVRSAVHTHAGHGERMEGCRS